MIKTRRDFIKSSSIIATSLASNVSISSEISRKISSDNKYVTCDISNIKKGESFNFEVEGFGFFLITHRTDEEIRNITNNKYLLSDKNSEKSHQPSEMLNEFRSIKKEIFVAVSICTHLGCVVLHVTPNQNNVNQLYQGGYFCPCHGGKFDTSGRLLSNNPAKQNLIVPEYEFINETKIRINLKNYHKIIQKIALE